VRPNYMTAFPLKQPLWSVIETDVYGVTNASTYIDLF
jgi:hypothetical protein